MLSAEELEDRLASEQRIREVVDRSLARALRRQERWLMWMAAAVAVLAVNVLFLILRAVS